MKIDLDSYLKMIPSGKFECYRFVPGDAVDMSFVASKFVQVIVLEYDDELKDK